ncbi:hypothetical protein [Streptomyces sp. NRRL S-813]|uniref:hypothetical protein n=1 Tax=Streptomyces sp. NRRL S-813 TaxID=1463919 RepID=UPI0004BE6908|nr:hypothetical protein [Streptomyces sp. NRRL S-813]
MCSANEGASASNTDFVVPVSVVPSDGGQARNIKVTVDTSGLKGVARAGKGGYGNCTGEGPVFTCLYGDLENGGDGEIATLLVLAGAYWHRRRLLPQLSRRH